MNLLWFEKDYRVYLKKELWNKYLQLVWLRWKWISRLHIFALGRRIPDRELKTHVYVTGKSWSGKSSLIEQLVYYHRWKSRKNKDRSIIVIDPHWDTVERIRKFDLAKKYFDRHIYLDPVLSKWHTRVINPLECDAKTSLDMEIQANQLMRAIQEMIPEAKLSNFMRAILKPCLYVMLSKYGTNLSDLQDMLMQEEWHWIELWKQCEIQAYADFFTNEWNDPMYTRTKQSIYTKLQSLLNSQVFYHMTKGPSTFKFPWAIKEAKVILFNLSKWKISEEIAETMWRFILAQIKWYALQRANVPGFLRNPIYLIIDEADTFISGDSLNVILKETRKYWLHLILITQNIVAWRGLMKLRRNLLNNTNTKIIGANGLWTLKALANETGIWVKILQKLWFHEFWIRYWAFYKKLIKTKDVFWKKSPLLLTKGKMVSQTNRMVHETWYYRPIQKRNSWQERIGDMPENWQQKMKYEHYPSPKFQPSLSPKQNTDESPTADSTTT